MLLPHRSVFWLSLLFAYCFTGPSTVRMHVQGSCRSAEGPEDRKHFSLEFLPLTLSLSSLWAVYALPVAPCLLSRLSRVCATQFRMLCFALVGPSILSLAPTDWRAHLSVLILSRCKFNPEMRDKQILLSDNGSTIATKNLPRFCAAVAIGAWELAPGGYYEWTIVWV